MHTLYLYSSAPIHVHALNCKGKSLFTISLIHYHYAGMPVTTPHTSDDRKSNMDPIVVIEKNKIPGMRLSKFMTLLAYMCIVQRYFVEYV